MSGLLLPESEVCEAYFDLQTRVYQLAEEMSDADSLKIVPHCPQWRVKDVLSHMVGVPEDVISGNMKGVATPEWTKKQVDRHAGHSVKEILACWSQVINTFKHVLPNIPQPTLSQFVFDQVSHEHDIRHAISRPGARDSHAVSAAEGFLRDLASRNINDAVQQLSGFPLSGFDYVRSLSGRRTLSQIRKSGLNETAILQLFSTSPFSIPEFEIEEN